MTSKLDSVVETRVVYLQRTCTSNYMHIVVKHIQKLSANFNNRLSYVVQFLNNLSFFTNRK